MYKEGIKYLEKRSLARVTIIMIIALEVSSCSKRFFCQNEEQQVGENAKFKQNQFKRKDINIMNKI